MMIVSIFFSQLQQICMKYILYSIIPNVLTGISIIIYFSIILFWIVNNTILIKITHQYFK